MKMKKPATFPFIKGERRIKNANGYLDHFGTGRCVAVHFSDYRIAEAYRYDRYSGVGYFYRICCLEKGVNGDEGQTHQDHKEAFYEKHRF